MVDGSGQRGRGGRLGRRPALVLVGALLASPGLGRAQDAAPSGAGTVAAERPVTAQLDWDPQAAAQGCSAAAQVRSDVEQLLGRSAFVARPGADLQVTVRFERGSPGWVARVGVRDASGAHRGDRVLHSMAADCPSLDGPMALVIALLLESSQPQVTLRLPARREAAQKPARPAPVDGDDDPWRALSDGGVVASGGLLPGFAVGAQLGLGVEPPRFVPVRVAVTIWPGAESLDAGRGGDFSAWLVGLGVCPTLAENARAGVGLCLGAEAGRMSATGVGLDYTESPARPLVQGCADVAAWLRVAGPFFVGIQAGASVPFIRPRFVYTAEGGVTEQVHRPWPVVPHGALRLGLTIPPPEDR